MSTVDKMLIKGIRSFDPENKNVITFFKPLTLIVGPNGAGKTTIIECLKLSCTGEMPPNSRSGQSFIHDPKVAGETETKGQIKLRFKTAPGKDVVCIRSFQLTQKTSKMEFKAIESVLQTINPHTGEKVCLSYRCADMDREIPALMGVSKAVLENVIFVHQDESNWPLQDPSTLKKKFDDIFSATRYTKALEVIKKLHKDQAQEIKTYKLKLENLQTLKDAAYKLRESINQDQEKAESIMTQIKDFEENIHGVETKILHAENTSKEMRKLQDQISTSSIARSTLFKLQQTQYAALAEENEDTDEELKEWQSKFEERIALLQSKIGKLERELNDEEIKSSLLSQTINDSLREIGKLQAEADAHISLRHERDSTIQMLFAKYNLGSLPDTPFSNEIASNFTMRVKTKLLDLEKDLQDKKKLDSKEVSFLWERHATTNARHSKIEGQKQAKIESKTGILKRMKEIENERDVAEHELSNLNLSHLDEKEKNLQIELERKTHLLGERDYDSNINQKRTEIFSLDQKIKALAHERDVMATDSDDRVRLGMRKDELEICKNKLKKIMGDCKDQIRGVLKGRIPSDKDLKKEITQAFRSVAKEHDDLNSKCLEAEKEVKLVQMKIEDAESHLSKLQKDKDAKRRFLDLKLQSLVSVSCDIESFPDVLVEAMGKKDVQKSKYNIADGMRQMFEPFERVARAHHICPCCERPFSPEEEDEFVKKQRVKSSSSAEHMKKLAEESSNSESQFQQLDKLRMVYEEYVKLGKEAIPFAEKSLNQLMEDLNEKSQAFDDLVVVLAQVKAEKDAVEGLLQPVETFDKFLGDRKSLEEQIEDLEYKLDVRGQGVKSVEEVVLQLNALQNKRDTLNQEVENLRDEQRYLNLDISNLQTRWHSVREEKLKATNILNKIRKTEEELVRLAEENEQLDLDEKHLAEDLVSVVKEKDTSLLEYNELKSRLEHEYDEMAENKRIFQQELEKLLALASKIKEYQDSRKGEKLKDLQDKHSLSKSQLQKCESMKQQISADLNKSKELMRNQDQLKRNIDDNLNYRKTKAEVEELTREIESLEEKVLSIGGASAVEADPKGICMKKRDFSQR